MLGDFITMNRVSIFNNPILLGFDQLELILNQAIKTSDGYPPYNIERLADNLLRITLAVAGFREENLQVYMENNQLIIRGQQNKEDEKNIYLYQGIAARQFKKSFVLAEGIEVLQAHLDNGLLHIDLQNPIPEEHIKEIKIISKKTKALDSNFPAQIEKKIPNN